MDPVKLRDYVEGYDRRAAARTADRRRTAEEASAAAPALAALCRSFGARRVRLFGSLVTGLHGSTPDIDLAVEGVPPAAFFSLYGALLDASPVSVDLVDIADAPPALRERIEADGRDL